MASNTLFISPSETALLCESVNTFTITCNKCGASVVMSLIDFFFEYTPKSINITSSYDGELRVACECGNSISEV